jgi:hypothetical protein
MTTRKLPAIATWLALLAFAAVLFFPALFQGKILAPLDITTRFLAPWKESAGGTKPHNHNPTDAVNQYLPYRIFAEKSLREDGYIGWNPYEMGGYSLAANTMALPGTWTMQLHRFLPFKDAWNLGLLAEFLIAGSGMLVFLRSRKLPWLPCLIGAVAYMANSQFVIWVYHRWALGSFCWMPWVLWSAVDGFSWKSPTTRQLLLPFFLALAILGGSLQHMVFVGIACACIVAGGIPDFKSLHKQWPLVTGWALAFLLALGMAAFTVVPQVLGYLTNIQIGHVRGGIGYPGGSSQPVLNLLAIPAQIWPWLLGDPQTIETWRLIKFDFMELAYLGTIPMVLAIAGLFRKSMPRQAKWLILVGLLIPLTPLVGPLYHRVQLLFLLGGAWMAAEMAASFVKYPPVKLARICSVAVIAIGALLAIGSLLPAETRHSIESQVVAKSIEKASDSQFGRDTEWIAQRAKRWTDRFAIHQPRTAWLYALLVTGTAGLVLSARSQDRMTRIGHLAILGATSLELFTFFQTWATFSPPADLTPEHPLIERVRDLAGPHRVFQGLDCFPIGDTFATPNLLAAYAIPSVDAYESIQYRSILGTLHDLKPSAALTLAGVGISVQPENTKPLDGTADWPVIETQEGFAIRKNTHPLSPIHSGHGPIPVENTGLLPCLSAATAITPSSQTMNRMEFEQPADSGWIRISQNWHPGWHWRTQGGSWQPLLKGSDAACWIDHPASQPSHIEVRFFPHPPWLSLGSLSTLLAWLILIPICCQGGYRATEEKTGR